MRQNPSGRIYGITFVDNQNKCVFNGSDLGKGYSAASLERRFIYPVNEVDNNSNLNTIALSDKNQNDSVINKSFQTENLKPEIKTNLLEELLEPEYPNNYNEALNLLKKKKRKKKYRNPNL